MTGFGRCPAALRWWLLLHEGHPHVLVPVGQLPPSEAATPLKCCVAAWTAHLTWPGAGILQGCLPEKCNYAKDTERQHHANEAHSTLVGAPRIGFEQALRQPTEPAGEGSLGQQPRQLR